MPHCPPPPQCDPTDDILVAPLQPGIADVGLVIPRARAKGHQTSAFRVQGTLDRSEGAQKTIVGYCSTTPPDSTAPTDASKWDGKRRIRTSTLRRVVDETWALWSIWSYVCSGDSGGAIFLNADPTKKDSNEELLVANVSDGGRDCRRQNNNNRLDTSTIQNWINDTIRAATSRELTESACRPRRVPRRPQSVLGGVFRKSVRACNKTPPGGGHGLGKHLATRQD